MNNEASADGSTLPFASQDAEGDIKRRARTCMILSGVGIAAVVAGGAALVHHWRVGRFLEETNDAYIAADVVNIASRVSGYVESVLVSDHQSVAQGQPLVRIDSRDYAAQVGRLRAQVSVQESGTDVVLSQISEQESSVAEARARLAAAQAGLDFARSEVARYAPMVETGAESAQQLQLRRRDLATSEQQVAASKAAVATAERRIATLQAQRRQAESQKLATDEQLKAARIELEAAEVRAGTAGVIGDMAVRQGQYVQAGTRLMSVVPLDRSYVIANFKETQIAGMHAGQRVVVRVDAFSGSEIRGHVDSISPGTGAQFSLLPPQNATGNFTKIVQRVPVRIALDPVPSDARRLTAGLSVSAEVDTRDVPAQAAALDARGTTR